MTQKRTQSDKNAITDSDDDDTSHTRSSSGSPVLVFRESSDDSDGIGPSLANTKSHGTFSFGLHFFDVVRVKKG